MTGQTFAVMLDRGAMLENQLYYDDYVSQRSILPEGASEDDHGRQEQGQRQADEEGAQGRQGREARAPARRAAQAGRGRLYAEETGEVTVAPRREAPHLCKAG